MKRKWLVSASLVSMLVSGCYIVPLDAHYPPAGQPPTWSSSTPAATPVSAPLAVPGVLQARLYPLNETAGKTGALTANVADNANGHATFSLNYAGEMLSGEASRVGSATSVTSKPCGGMGARSRCARSRTSRLSGPVRQRPSLSIATGTTS